MSSRQILAYLGTMAAIAVLVANPTDYGLADSIEREMSGRTRQAVPATREPLDADGFDLLVDEPRQVPDRSEAAFVAKTRGHPK